MTTGNVLYLMLCLGMFTAFALVLAYESWQQSRIGRDVVAEPDRNAGPHDAIAA